MVLISLKGRIWFAVDAFVSLRIFEVVLSEADYSRRRYRIVKSLIIFFRLR